MQNHLDLTASLGHATHDGKPHEVFTEGDAVYDGATRTLTMTLDSYLRPCDAAHLGERVVAVWLPPKQVDHEHVDADEASDLAKDVFHRWCSKVEGLIPADGA